ncbi:MAG: ParB/RepB/Spo0J family partition protein [Firmicutes bacterium]|nr:ParB/RepB/Spo0J family partition protein [Bacillota bacterium]
MSRQALGKGLRALMGTGEQVREQVQQINLDQIRPNPFQPRRTFDEASLEELSDSIRRQGVLQPVVVRPMGEGYELIVGERRWRASAKAGLKEIPAIVRHVSDEEMMAQALVENIQREDLNPIEEAHAYRQLMQLAGLTQEELAAMVGKKRPTIANSLRLLSLTAEVQQMVLEGKLSAGHAKVLLSLEGKEQVKAAVQVVEKGLSVRETERLVQSLAKKKVPRGTTKKPSSLSPQLAQVENMLQEALGTRVRIKPRGKSAGRIEIEYYTSEDINRIVNSLLGE